MKTQIRIHDLATSQSLSRQAAAEIRGGLAQRGSPFAVSPIGARDFVPTGNPGPSIEDAASWGDDSSYYGLRPLR
jgi:hypothetical protein